MEERRSQSIHNDENQNYSRRRVPTLRDSALSRSHKQAVAAAAAATAAATSAPVSPMQRYFPLLCTLQTIVIGLIIFYLYWSRPTNDRRESPILIDQPPTALSSISQYRVYTNGTIRTRLLPDLAAGCSQRKHDLHSGSVVCLSKNVAACQVSTGFQVDYLAGRPTDGSFLKAQIITTSKGGKRLHSQWVALPRHQDCQESTECDTDSRTKILIGNDAQQSIIGWGGAMTDSSINNILSLSTNGTMQLLDDYYGPDGLQFNIVRITIGSSDFSARFYTNNDKLSPDEPDDTNMTNFRLTPEDSLYKIPILRYIQSKYGESTVQGNENRIKLFASMWSPPTWMKTNNHFNKGQLKGSISISRMVNSTEESYYRALAELKKQFILAYQRNSIKFWGMTVMNEPVFAVQPFLDFNTMIFPKHDYADYIAKYLGPLLKEHPELGHIKLMAHDDNRRFLLDFMEPTLNRTASGRYIDGVSVHGYADKDYYQMDLIYKFNRDKDLFVLPTELCSGHLPWMQKALAGNWHRGVHYALDIIHSLQHSAAGWIDWNMALDMEGGPGWLGGRLDSPVLVDKINDLYHKSPMFFVLGQFSRYIPAGSKRLDSVLINGAYNYPLETVTFRTAPKTSVTVILNANPHKVSIYLRPYGFGALYKVSCDADSVTTIRLNLPQ